MFNFLFDNHVELLLSCVILVISCIVLLQYNNIFANIFSLAAIVLGLCGVFSLAGLDLIGLNNYLYYWGCALMLIILSTLMLTIVKRKDLTFNDTFLFIVLNSIFLLLVAAMLYGVTNGYSNNYILNIYCLIFITIITTTIIMHLQLYYAFDYAGISVQNWISLLFIATLCVTSVIIFQYLKDFTSFKVVISLTYYLMLYIPLMDWSEAGGYKTGNVNALYMDQDKGESSNSKGKGKGKEKAVFVKTEAESSSSSGKRKLGNLSPSSPSEVDTRIVKIKKDSPSRTAGPSLYQIPQANQVKSANDLWLEDRDRSRHALDNATWDNRRKLNGWRQQFSPAIVIPDANGIGQRGFNPNLPNQPYATEIAKIIENQGNSHWPLLDENGFRFLADALRYIRPKVYGDNPTSTGHSYPATKETAKLLRKLR